MGSLRTDLDTLRSYAGDLRGVASDLKSTAIRYQFMSRGATFLDAAGRLTPVVVIGLGGIQSAWAFAEGHPKLAFEDAFGTVGGLVGGIGGFIVGSETGPGAIATAVVGSAAISTAFKITAESIYDITEPLRQHDDEMEEEMYGMFNHTP